ncbi:MAG: hypothetical protein WBF20_13375 [Trebonia sp.]|uniref:hypothetical protein n=1 Tax=Trebonia sp. TaxID=2767075 RepID=UPI003BAF9DDB
MIVKKVPVFVPPRDRIEAKKRSRSSALPSSASDPCAAEARRLAARWPGPFAPIRRGRSAAAAGRRRSPTVHRLALELSDRQATAFAAAIAETEAVTPEIAKLRGIALAGVFQIIITEAGRRTREGQGQNQIADELRPAIEAVLDDLDAWLTSATDQRNRNRAT